MPKFIMSALPGLLVGLIFGFGVARLSQGDDDDDQAEKNRIIAKACMAEAKKVLVSMDRPSRGRNEPPRAQRPASGRDEAASADPAARAKRTIETTLKRAKTEKAWTVAHGKMAERMFPRLSPEDATDLSKKILAAVESGDVKAEDKAWLPEKK